MTIIDEIKSESTYISSMKKWGSLRVKYSIRLTYKGISRDFDWFCGITVEPSKEGLLYCLMRDFDYINLEDMQEIGYDIEYKTHEREEAENIIRKIKHNNEKLLTMFSASEIEEIKTLTEDYLK